MTEEQLVDDLVASARVAQQAFEASATQERYDLAAKAAAWALMEPERNKLLSELAVKTTGLGNVADKIRKNHRKTLGLLRDLEGVSTTGVLSRDEQSGITEFSRPIGVVGAVVPSTNPAATPTNNIVNALKCGNAILISPSPKGAEVCEVLMGFIHAELDKVGIDKQLVQMVPAPASKVKTQRLMESSDLIIVTGSQDNVRRAYSSGTPALGVGAGNATVIIDETADLTAAANKIAASKTFDNATSCSSENAIIVVDAVREPFLKALHEAGGRLLNEEQSNTLKAALFTERGLSRFLIAKDIDKFLQSAKLDVEEPDTAKFVVMPTTGIGPDHPESGEKLSLALALYAAKDFGAARELAATILAHQGAGHSVGLHSTHTDRALILGSTLPACRVIVNQAHCFATGGSFDNGLPFSLSMGCGSWGGNSIDSNLNYQHFLNRTMVVEPIAPREPDVADVLSDYWAVAGR